MNVMMCINFSIFLNFRWGSIPHHYSELIEQYTNGKIISFNTPVHVCLIPERKIIRRISSPRRNGLKIEKYTKSMFVNHVNRIFYIRILTSRYGVIRRSPTNPIFYPHYINYGFNKVSLIIRLVYDRRK